VIAEDTDLKIANVNFAFSNNKLLALLQQRGTMIVAGKYGSLAEVNKQIETCVYQNRDEIIRPVTAFISFETQEGYERAVKAWTLESHSGNVLNNHNSLLKDLIHLQRAPEPSNILWENLHVSRPQRIVRTIVVAIVIFLLLLGMFALFTALEVISVKNIGRYPPTTNCANIDAMFTNNATYEAFALTDRPFTDYQQGTGIY
jgi:hypothetical protein